MFGFRISLHKLDSGFQCGGFHISQTKITWVSDSGLSYMGRKDPAIAFVNSSAITEPLNNPEMFTWLCNWNKYHGLEFEIDWLM